MRISDWSSDVCSSDLDLSDLEASVKSREGHPGHPAISPRLQLALWLYAAKDGVGSARALARLCEQHDAYRWLCGGVSVNPHTLSDFRSAEHTSELQSLMRIAYAGVSL